MTEHANAALRWIPLLPLVAAVLSGVWLVFTRRELPRAAVIGLACGAPIASFAIAVVQVLALATSLPADERFYVDNLYTWISAGDFHAELSFLLDPLSAVMVLVVTGVGSLIHIYAVGYMDDDQREDRGFQRFFAYLNLFTFSMLMLILGDNLLVMFVGWEGVGLCSYLLIGFWFLDDYNAKCGQKAFVVNRIGDFGFLLGIFLLFWSFTSAGLPTVEFREMAANIGLVANQSVELPDWLSFLPGYPRLGLLTLACLCLFIGACGKSAQIPLYVWLPDAMAGPTPVSALIHAATMVTAGVYMICRMSFAFSLAPGAQATVAWTGALTAFFAATIGLAQTDIKRVLAYSTVSQLGYMFLAAGVAAYSSAIFHVMTHAFFKALLFLAAGSVILGMHHEQDITRMGGLRTRMPVTWATFLVGVIAIAGVPPFSGFFSKDEILLAAHEAHGIPGNHLLWLIGLATAGLTAFYMFRLYYLVFTGQSRADHHTQAQIHESTTWVLFPLVVLALLSVIGGFFGLPDAYGELFGVQESNSLHHFLQPVVNAPVHAVDHATEFGLAALTTLVGLAGIALATLLYYWRRDWVAGIVAAIHPLYALVRDKYRIDELYDVLIVRPLGGISRGLLARVIDQGMIDGLGVNGVANSVRSLGDGALKYLQTGFAQSYIFAMLLGGALLVAWLVRGT